MYIGKYEFNSKEQAQEKIDALGTSTDENGNEYPTHKHSIVELGNIVLEQGEYDENGKESWDPVYMCRTGSFLRYADYARYGGYPPKPCGYLICHVRKGKIKEVEVVKV